MLTFTNFKTLASLTYITQFIFFSQHVNSFLIHFLLYIYNLKKKIYYIIYMTTYAMETIAILREKIEQLEMDIHIVQNELEIYKFEEQQQDGYIYFNGIDNCGECKGWNGSDDRCQCGNQRVAWFYNHEKPQYPIARSH
jgi:hypothetical protein